MLTDDQINRVWQNMLAAEARSLYFGDLGSRYTRRKQWITDYRSLSRQGLLLL